jgi:hypothetical protein
MTRRRMMFMTVVVLGLIAPGVVGCAASSTSAGSAPVESATESTATPTPSGPGPEAEAQAQAWLDAATVPPGATPSSSSPAAFNSFTGWVCQPVATLEAFWTVPDMTVTAAANWLITHPTADLVTTAGEPWPEEQDVDESSVGYVPADKSQQGVVYTVVRMDDGVAIRAEIAALDESAVCPDAPDGGEWGLPGQG